VLVEVIDDEHDLVAELVLDAMRGAAELVSTPPES
jgi:hypothetical protein